MNLTPPPIARVGDLLDNVGTPALLLELDAFEANLEAMASLAKQHGVALRPHAKAHKSVAVAKAQLVAGAVGICCQKLSEAYPFAAAGIKDIFVSNEFIGHDKMKMAVELARHAKLSVCVDHADQIATLGAAAKAAGVAITAIAEVDIGQGRCGATGADELLALVDGIAAQGALAFGGVQAYHGGIQHRAAWGERREAALRSPELAAGYVRALAARGIACPVVTGGGTGTAEFDAESGVFTEIQPGSYAFMDAHYGANEWWGAFQPRHALFIAATVMSANRPGRLVCDLGLKGVAVDSGLPRIVSEGGAGLTFVAANDEHGIVEIRHGETLGRLGERLLLVPGHCDPTVNLYRQFVAVRAGQVEAMWDIEAQGLNR